MEFSVHQPLTTGISRLTRLCAARPRPCRATARHVHLAGGEIGQRAHGLDERLHVEQHALDVGMISDGRAGLRAERAALNAVMRIGAGLLIGALRNGDALQSDIKAGVVHHREHIFEAAIGLADQIADRAALFAEGHDRRRAGVDAELVLDRGADQIVARAERAIRVDQEFRAR